MEKEKIMKILSAVLIVLVLALLISIPLKLIGVLLGLISMVFSFILGAIMLVFKFLLGIATFVLGNVIVLLLTIAAVVFLIGYIGKNGGNKGQPPTIVE